MPNASGSATFRSGIRLGTLVFALACVPAGAQQIQLGDALSNPDPAHHQHVEQETAVAHARRGQPDWIEVRFRVDPGIHINSHSPKDELLIPTSLQLSPAEPLKVLRQEYPGGIPLRLEIGSGEVLSTYQGEFAIRLQVLLPQDQATLSGTLRYQACDAHSCFPPKALPVNVSISAGR